MFLKINESSSNPAVSSKPVLNYKKPFTTWLITRFSNISTIDFNFDFKPPPYLAEQQRPDPTDHCPPRRCVFRCGRRAVPAATGSSQRPGPQWRTRCSWWSLPVRWWPDNRRPLVSVSNRGFKGNIKNAWYFTRCRTNATGELGKVVGLQQLAQRLVPVALEDQLVPFGDDVAQWTAGVALAEGYATVHAPKRFFKKICNLKVIIIELTKNHSFFVKNQK